MKTILFCLIFSSVTLFGQKTDGFCSEYGYFGESVNEIKIRFYGDYQRKIIRYDNFSQVKNETPLDLVTSQFSATSNKWISYNYNREMSWDKSQFDRLNDKENKIIYVADFQIKIKDSVFNISRLDLFDKSKRKMPICLTMKKENGRWFFTERNYLNNLSFVLMTLDLKLIDDVFIKKKSEDSIIQKVINEVYINKVLNLSSLIKKIGNLSLENKINYNNEYLSKETSIDLTLNYNIPIFNQSFCEYFKNYTTDFTDSDLDVLIGDNKNMTPLLKYKYREKNIDKIFFKYLITENNLQKYVTTMYKKTDVIINDTPTNTYDETILSLFKLISANVFIQFSNNNDNPKYPVINKLKPLVKDADGVLNIYKLAEVIEKNKASLSKYLDE
jgi:hypothetical protein